ncbi:MAG: PAS domain S-box protein, partial [Actinomycetota bacterium]|nr:PAS domain S-box protein [Actinomycetota bacterium]
MGRGAAWISDASAYRQIVERANEGIWVLDLSGEIEFANDKLCEILGYGAGELTGSSVYDLLDEAGQTQLRAHLEQHRRQDGSADSVECSFLRKDGSRVWVQVSRSPLRDAGRRAIAVVSVVTDITRRRVVESRLRNGEWQLAESQWVAHLGSWLWDVATETLTWSDGLYRIFGLIPQELTPTFGELLARVHADDRAMLIEQVGATLGHGLPYEHEARFIRSDGEQVWVKGHGQAELGDSGVPVRLFGTAQDITATRRIETALRGAPEHSRLLQVVASGANQASTVEDALQIKPPRAVDEERL